MSGKMYTMKEMKGIVTYLTEHQAYGEIRGRKMWVDFANSNATTRTWQSLKETFLKRILPDIQNPYYNLTREQIISFRQGYDVEQRAKNKLEIEPVGDISNNNTENNEDNEEQVVTSSDEAMVQGENDKCSNVTTKDIPVQETCYKTIDDLRRDLESPMIEDENKSTYPQSKETPPVAVQAVLKDFEIDSENVQEDNSKITSTEKQNVIDLNPLPETDKSKSDLVSCVQEKNSNDVNVKPKDNNCTEKQLQIEENNDNIDKNPNSKDFATDSEKGKDVSDDILEISSTNSRDKDATFNKKKETQESISTNLTSSIQALISSNSESLLPNNQEGLNIQTKNASGADNTIDTKIGNKKPIRKRSSSAETVLIENKKQKTNTDKICEPAENESEPEIFDVIDSDSEIAPVNKVNEAETINIISSQSVDNEPTTQNPCLESVSLFAEQFNKVKYVDTTSDDNVSKKNEPQPSGSKEAKKDDDVVVLKSHSESESGEESTEIGRKISKRVNNAKRKNALANVFGVYSGAVSSRKRQHSNQNKVRRSHKVPRAKDDAVSDSSEWTTDTEHDTYVSPPRARKHRGSRKYLKPKSARVLSLEEEGGLFVMYRKKIYPLVKDGRIVKNFVIYESNSDSGFEQDTYWKAKYAELKKKYEEKKKAKEPSERPRSVSKEPSSPILQPTIRKNPPPVQNYDVNAPSTSTTYPVVQTAEPVLPPPAENKTLDKITIKYIMSNAEVQLEGHWPQICPVFDKVLDRLPKKAEPPKTVNVKRNSLETPEVPNFILSGESTPIMEPNDPAVQEKIDKLESEIFKKIEENDKEEQIDNDTEENTVNFNVTQRKRGRPMKQSGTPKTPKKQVKSSPSKKKISTVAKNTSETVEKQGDVNKIPEITPVRTRRSMKAILDTQKESKVAVTTQDSSNTPQTTTNRNQRPRSFADQIVFQDDSLWASESTQGYHDSDISPVKLKKRRKSKRATIANRNKLQIKRYQRKSLPYLVQESSSESTSYSGSLKSQASQSSSEVHKSDSYRHLFPRAKISFDRLEPISEKSPTVNEIEMRPIDVACRNQLYTDSMDSETLINGNTGVGSSSNVSLPQSPELSVVEDISIGKELLNSIKDYHNMKGAQTIEVTMEEEQDKYMITDVDVTLPLMEQKCVLQKSNEDVVMKNSNNTNRQKKKPSDSESLLNKICTVKISDNSSVSDSLDLQLRNLLLESAKKMSKASLSKENMEIDENILNTMQKSKTKRRCSTPRKKKETAKSKLFAQTITEEHLETCSYRARKSCPPSVQTQEENSLNRNEINIDTVGDVKNKPKGRKKKDIIKVKILRPRYKSVTKEPTEDFTQKASKMSICTDSGIHGTGSGVSFPISNDTVELIHNHSETCIHANECLSNSVEFVDGSTTIISVNSNSMTAQWQDSRHFKDTDDMSLCSLNNNEEGACNNMECIKTYTREDKCKTIFKSPANNEISNSSLITEDLSDEAPAQPVVPPHPSRWYLLSEDESTNTNIVSPPSNTGGFGSNLNQIFPIICAVPNLSTITEMSKDSDSRKPFGLDSFTRDSNSQNIFL